MAETLKLMDCMDQWKDGCIDLTKGSIHLHGGRGLGQDLSFVQFRKNFVECGKRALPWSVSGFLGRVNIVIISCGWKADDLWKEWGQVTELNLKSRADADSIQICSLIDSAQCVWFTGGDQSILRGALRGTRMADALQRLLARQGAVGGASAGASLLCALCPNFDEIMEGLNLIPGLVLSHVLRRDRQDRLAAIADCFRGLWCWGLDGAAGLVLMGNQLHVTCRSPVLAVRHDESACLACLLVPGFQGSLQEVEKQMKEFHSIHWHPEQVMAKGTELWSVHWSGQHALADGPIQGVETNGNFQGVESHQFLSWKLPMEDASALVFGSHYHLSITFDLEDLPLICCLLLVQCAGPGDEAEIKLNEHLLQGDGRQWMLPYKFQVKTYHLPMGTLRLGSNTLRVAMQDVKSQYCVLSATLLDEGEQEMVQQILPSTLEPALPRRRSSDSSSSTPRWGYLHRGASETEDEHEEPVRLNIYDLGKSNTVQSLNGWLKPVGMGAFHCAVQVYGVEWSYGGWLEENHMEDESDATGIWSCLPQMSGDHTFREAVPMGSISFSEEDTVELIYSLMKEWPMSEYDILNKNCCHFCEELCQLLGLGPLPSRVKKLAGLGATLNESAHVAADQVFQVASKVTSDIVGAGYVATNLAVQAALSGASALADAPRRLSRRS